MLSHFLNVKIMLLSRVHNNTIGSRKGGDAKVNNQQEKKIIYELLILFDFAQNPKSYFSNRPASASASTSKKAITFNTI